MIEEIIRLLAGLVVFVTGMNMMAAGFKNATGRQIRRLFRRIGDRRIVSALVGAGTTAIIQSSGATSVLTVGFLSAGALTFEQGLSVMLGAFVGTNITGVFVALSSFSFSVYLMFAAFIGFALGFFKKESLRNFGEILVGFGILFFGLEAMKSAFDIPEIRDAVYTVIRAVDFPPLLVLIGAALTAITQSSSATNGIVIVMAASNPNLLYSGFYLVLGATIGAMLPAIIASARASILAKRAVYTTLLLRTAGALLAMGVMMAVSPALSGWLSAISTEHAGLILVLFASLYNVLFMIAILPLLTPVRKAAEKLIPDRASMEKQKELRYLDERLINTPSLAVLQAQKEIGVMFELARQNTEIGIRAMLTGDLSKEKELAEREEKIDMFNAAIAEYLIKLSPKASLQDEVKVAAYYHAINDVERIGDHAVNFMEMAKKMSEEDLAFSKEAIHEFSDFASILTKMFDLSYGIFMEQETGVLGMLHELEEKTDRMKETYENSHFERIKKNQCNTALTPFQSNLLTELERIADHLTNIGYSVESPVGDEIRHTEE